MGNHLVCISQTSVLRSECNTRSVFGGKKIVRVFANGLGDWGSILGRVKPKTQKMVIDASLLIRYGSRVKWLLMPLCIIRYGSRVKWSNPGKRVAPFPTTRCSSYWKGSLRVTPHPRLRYLEFSFPDTGCLTMAKEQCALLFSLKFGRKKKWGNTGFELGSPFFFTTIIVTLTTLLYGLCNNLVTAAAASNLKPGCTTN